MRSPVFALLGSLVLSTTLNAQIVSTVAGDAGVAGLRDGVGTQAQFNRPTWVDVDRSTGVIYVVDRANQKLRRIVNGVVGTIEVEPPWWVQPFVPLAFDFGGPYGGGIAVEPASAGCGGATYGHGLFVSSSAQHQLIFLADLGTHVTFTDRDDSSPFIGAGAPGAIDSPQTTARFNHPGDVALSWNYGGSGSTYTTDRLYIADTGNHTIRRIAADGTVTTVAGKAGVAGHNDGIATDALLNSPSGLDVNNLGELFIADTGNFVVRKLTLDGRLITIAGTPGIAGYADGPARAARFSGPIGLRLIDDSLYIADTANNVIRKLDLRPSEPRRRAISH